MTKKKIAKPTQASNAIDLFEHVDHFGLSETDLVSTFGSLPGDLTITSALTAALAVLGVDLGLYGSRGGSEGNWEQRVSEHERRLPTLRKGAHVLFRVARAMRVVATMDRENPQRAASKAEVDRIWAAVVGHGHDEDVLRRQVICDALDMFAGGKVLLRMRVFRAAARKHGGYRLTKDDEKALRKARTDEPELLREAELWANVPESAAGQKSKSPKTMAATVADTIVFHLELRHSDVADRLRRNEEALCDVVAVWPGKGAWAAFERLLTKARITPTTPTQGRLKSERSAWKKRRAAKSAELLP